jgi:hypothetical protein
MKKRRTFLLMAGLMIFVFFTGSAPLNADAEKGHSKMGQHYEDTLFAASEKGHFSVEAILPDEGPEMGVNKIDLIIHDKNNRDVPGAEITVIPWMPSMDHGIVDKPIVSERGGGLYAISNVVFNMTGEWELRVRIRAGKITDNVTLQLPAVGAMGHTHSMGAPDYSKIDTASDKMSRSGHFHVSYTSNADPVPLNRIHSWTMKIMTPDGKPVTGAKVLIVGDMPEHGHGFPTEPEVTEESKGLYAVEGVKFSMPGWWVVTFHIAAGGQMDHVSFNRILQ